MTTFALQRWIPALVLVLLAACVDSSPTAVDAVTPAAVDAGALPALVAHDPATHGVAGSVTKQSLTAQPSYTGVDAGSATVRGGSVHLTVNSGGSIPRFPDTFITSIAVFGYAWADLETGAALVSVIHPVIGRDSRQNPDGWHTHPVQLGGGTSTSSFCVVSIGGSQAGIRIHGDAMNLSLPAGWLPGVAADLDVVAAFIVQADAGCLATGLGVAVLDAEAI